MAADAAAPATQGAANKRLRYYFVLVLAVLSARETSARAAKWVPHGAAALAT